MSGRLLPSATDDRDGVVHLLDRSETEGAICLFYYDDFGETDDGFNQASVLAGERREGGTPRGLPCCAPHLLKKRCRKLRMPLPP